MYKKLSLAAALVAASIAPAHAAYLNGFGDVSVNYLHWSKGTQARAPWQQNFTYLELEGGANFTWGELYGFADWNNPTKSSEHDGKMGTSVKGTIAVKTGLAQLRMYGQFFNTSSEGFTAQHTVLGVSYPFSGQNWYFVPYIGANASVLSSAKNFSGWNGGALGWTAGYNFSLFNQSFSLTDWSESWFGRTKQYIKASGEANKLNANGALALWWNMTPNLTAGVQYRYSFANLGSVGNQNAIISTVKYNF